jgi:hypothetical protein
LTRASGGRTAGLFVALVVAGCGAEPPAPGDATAPLVTDARRYVLRPARVGSEATIIALFRAPADRPVHVLHCNGAISWGLQKKVGGRWVDAWITETNGCLSPPLVVPAGGDRLDTLVLVSRTDIPPGAGTVRHAIEPGTYRLAWHNVLTSFDPDARPMGPDLPIEQRVSGPITIDGGP